VSSRKAPGLRDRPPAVDDRGSAEAFIRWCVREIGPGYHPDTPAADYEDRDGGPSFTPDEVALLDALHERAAGLLGGDPSGIALDEWETAFGAGRESRSRRTEEK
jgi:hypothetical protein